MIIKIENNAFSAEIDTKGAELQNLIRKPRHAYKQNIRQYGECYIINKYI